MYNPCLECKLRYNKEYTEDCNDKCDYANITCKLKTANTKMEDYYNQQKNNEHFSEQDKRLVCRIIENCQKIINETCGF